MAPPLTAPAMPELISYSAKISVPRPDSHAAQSTYVQTSLDNAPPASSKVVININTDVREEIFCIERPNAGCKGGQRANTTKRDSSDAGAINTIDTTAFVSDTERHLEKQLITKGFRVINRARLEAKLREMRDSRDDCKRNWYESADCLNRLPEEARNLMDFYKDNHKKGKISDLDFMTKTEELRNKYEVGSAGKKREQNEMTDVSEVIRAAKDGEIGADYIMLINGFTFEPAIQQVNFTDFDQIREIQNKNPQIESWLNRYSHAQCHYNSIKLNASLVHVKTGEVIWIGEHQVHEGMLNTAPPLEMIFDYKPAISNETEINDFIAAANTEAARKQRSKEATPTTLPEWKVNGQMLYKVSSGKCDSLEAYNNRDQRRLQDLTDLVARELISTIRVQ